MKKLLLFIHGLGGDEKTWGNFPDIIENDDGFEGYDVEIYSYPTSLVRPKEIVAMATKAIPSSIPFAGVAAKVLPAITPQTKLPKIQEIAQGLKTEIEHRYKKYDEIFLVTHSMGGLVAKKYLIDEIKLYQRETLKVKKLLLYAVPNNGSNWALLSKVYNHEQIEQLGKSSDFIEFLNTDSAVFNLEKHVETTYIIGTQDDIVDKQSAQAMWANKKLETLHRGHIDIVKPMDSDDLSYVVFRSLILDSFEVNDETFVSDVIDGVDAQNIVVLFSQDYTDIGFHQGQVREVIEKKFCDDFYHFSVPFNGCSKEEYFEELSKNCGISADVLSPHRWKKEMQSKLKDSSRFLLFVTDLEDGNSEYNRNFAEILRSFKSDYPNIFYAIVIGRKELANLVHGDGDLSPLNTAKELFFPESELDRDDDEIIQQLTSLQRYNKQICKYLEKNTLGMASTWSQDEALNQLFWKNLIKKEGRRFVWKSNDVREISRELFQCNS